MSITGRPCDEHGKFLPEGAPPPPRTTQSHNNFEPFDDRVHFEAADFLYTRNQMSAGDIDFLGLLWAATLLKHNSTPPFSDHKHLYETIDSIKHGDVPWQSRTFKYTGKVPDPKAVPSWMSAGYNVCFRDPRQIVHNMLANPDFDGEFDYTPVREHTRGGQRRKDFMSGDWAWEQADIIGKDPETHGSVFVPIILGSDKTTVSVATGQNEYYPLYMSIGNVHNNVRRAHRNALVLLGFLAVPKSTKEHNQDPEFRRFRRQLVHTTLSVILQSIKSGITKPEVVRCPDGHFRKAIFGIGLYIADYPEQVLLACIVQGWCPKYV
ncbi:hypothetical protein OBBRIDRAFT_706114, partial [Obba rivulosa]